MQLAASETELLFRTAVHCSLFALYGLGGWLVQRKLLPIRVLLSAIGFTFSLVFATQGVVQTLADTRRVISSMQRWSLTSFCEVSCRVQPPGPDIVLHVLFDALFYFLGASCAVARVVPFQVQTTLQDYIVAKMLHGILLQLLQWKANILADT